MRPLLLATAAMAASGGPLFVPREAAADSFSFSRSDKLVERAHLIDVRLSRGYADLVVERTVFNGGERPDQSTFFVELPEGAVATRLRTLGKLDGSPHWFEGQLMEAEAAAARYQELTGIGAYYPKDPAILSWRDQTTLALQVFPCMPGEPKTVSYSLRIPTTYEDGRDRLTLPVLGTDDVVPVVTVHAVHPGDQLLRDDEPIADAASFDLREQVELSLEHSQSKPVEGALASVGVDEDHALVRFRFDAAPRLSEVPRNAHVVILIDGSRSFGTDRMKSAGAMMQSYLEHFKGTGAVVDVAMFDRTATPIVGSASTVEEAIAALKTTSLKPQNGSELAVALQFAERQFSSRASSTRRVVLLTDFQTREALTPQVLLPVAHRLGATIHLAEVRVDDAPELIREDEHDWAPVARHTGGVLWDIRASAAPDAAHHLVAEELARPIRIDNLEFPSRGAELTFDPIDALDEGQSIEHFMIEAGPVHAVALKGQLWSKPIVTPLFADTQEGKRWAGLFFGSELLDQLDEAQQTPLAWHGRVVSPVTSFLAIEPGVRPSTEGLEWGGGTGTGFGAGGLGLVGIGSGGSGIQDRANLQGWLERAIRPLTKRCQVAAAHVGVETTHDEIVDVTVHGKGLKAEPAACLREAVWSITLDPIFAPHGHRTFTVSAL